MTNISDQLQQPWFQGRQAISNAHKQNALTNARKNAADIKRGLLPTLKHKEQWGFGATRSWAITTSSKNRETAAAFLAYLARPEHMLKHNESFGFLPAKATVASQAYKADPEFAQLTAAQTVTFDEQKHKYGRDMMSLVVPEIQAAITKAKSPKQALDDAAGKVREMFAKG
jgi:multiple sugar transport system substrate-binding protein